MKCDWCTRTATRKLNLHYDSVMFGCAQHATLAKLDRVYRSQLVSTEEIGPEVQGRGDDIVKCSTYWPAG